LTPAFAGFLVLVGAGTGVYGTLVGLGGGFILVPLLLFLYPEADPKTITSISLAVVFFNALSGTVAYARMKRIDYGIAIPYALVTIPGAVLGASLVAYVSRGVFTFVFGLFLLAVSAALSIRPNWRPSVAGGKHERLVVDRWGFAHVYRTNFGAGLALSFLAGFIASLLGLGGGIIQMPVLITILQFPVHIATATSQFVLVITTFSASLTHLLDGAYGESWAQVLLLSLGVVVGAQVGAKLSSRVGGGLIVRLLAMALMLVGLRLVVGGILH
jgi:uncharacterized protein